MVLVATAFCNRWKQIGDLIQQTFMRSVKSWFSKALWEFYFKSNSRSYRILGLKFQDALMVLILNLYFVRIYQIVMHFWLHAVQIHDATMEGDGILSSSLFDTFKIVL